MDNWYEPYPDIYVPMNDEGYYGGSGDIEYDKRCPLTTGLADVVDFVYPSMVPGFEHVASFRDTLYAQNTLYSRPETTSVSQRQLHIDTQLSPQQFNDPESSTASSTSLQVLRTPNFQSYSNFQPSIYTPSPQSGPAEIETLITDPEKLSPLPVSPSVSCYSPNFEGDMFDVPASSLPPETDIVTQVQMPHITEWKRVIEICGTNDFIPQGLYQPYTEADRKRYIRDVELRETIFFHASGSSDLGMSLDDILKQRLKHLKDKDDRMFVGCGPSVSIRIQWPGYSAWSKQIPTMDFKTPKGHITRAKLAKNIATCIRRFAESVQDKPMEAESDIRWKIGKRQIGVEDLVLVSLHHVSKGSWQPQLRLRSPMIRSAYP